MAASPSNIALDLPAPDFSLPGVDGRTYRFRTSRREGNGRRLHLQPLPLRARHHRPARRRRAGADERRASGFAAICSNDAATYPDNSFPRMKVFAEKHDLPFPYLHDETQAGSARL